MSDLLQHGSLNSGLSGVAGEYFVAGELSRRGFIESITLRNARGIDILATRPESTVTIGIQVKTNQYSRRHWPLNQKIEGFARPDLYFVFVNLNSSNEPSYHVVPSAAVAEHCRTGHAAWLATPGKGGRRRRDNPVRTFSDLEGKYLGRWELLENHGA